MSAVDWSDDERIEHIARGPLPAAREIIDLPVLRPEHDRAARLAGKWIGAGWFWAEQGAKWAAMRAWACLRWLSSWAARRVRP